MKNAAVLFLLTAFVALVGLADAQAQTRCRSDAFGNSTCRDNDGNTIRGRTDSFGNSTFRDNNGNTMRGRTDSFGNSTFRDNDGNTVRGRTDSFGNSTFRDNNGNTTRCPVRYVREYDLSIGSARPSPIICRFHSRHFHS